MKNGIETNPERMLQLYVSTMEREAHASYESLDWPQLLGEIAKRCHSFQSGELIFRMPLLADESIISRRFCELREWMSLYEMQDSPPTLALEDLGQVIEAAQHGVSLSAEDLISVGRNLSVFDAVQRYFKKYAKDCPLLYQYVEDMADCRALSKRIEAVFTPDGSIADKASAELAKLRESSRRLSEGLRKRIESKLTDSSIVDLLQDTYYTQREGRYVLPIRSSSKSKILGIVHGTSSSGQTIFVEPADLVELNNALRMADFEIEAEEYRILQSLSLYVGEQLGGIKSNFRRTLYFDMLSAIARFSFDCEAHIPEISKSEIELFRARHPLLALRASEKKGFKVVANDIFLNAAHTSLIISGANAGGKTVTLKTLGLFSLMMKTGIPLSAGSNSSFPIFEQVFAEIGDEQSIANDTSTFSARVIALSQALAVAKANSLFLLDEPFSGTDPDHASALVISLISAIHELGAHLVLTTHFDSVKAYSLEQAFVQSASVGFDLSRMQATYKLVLGQPGSSSAFEIARMHGLPQAILEDAKAIYEGKNTSKLENVIERLEAERVLLEDARAQASEKLAALEKDREEMQKLLEKMQNKDIEALGKEFVQVHEKVQKIRSRLKHLRNASYSSKLKDEQQELSLLERQLHETQAELREAENSVKDLKAETFIPLSEEEIKLGNTAYAKSYRKNGQIISIKASSVVLQMGVLQIRVEKGDLGRPQREETKRESKKKKKYQVTQTEYAQDASIGLIDEETGYATAPQTQANTLDLRGLTGDDAVERCEFFLENLSLQSQPVAYIIHGHGTGVLKQEIRMLLKRSSLVRAMRAGKYYEGGDGISIAFLRESHD